MLGGEEAGFLSLGIVMVMGVVLGGVVLSQWRRWGRTRNGKGERGGERARGEMEGERGSGEEERNRKGSKEEERNRKRNKK